MSPLGKQKRNAMTIDEFMRDIAPKMRPGWVAMNKDGRWFYFTYEPRIIGILWWGNDYETSLSMFDIAPVDDWKNQNDR